MHRCLSGERSCINVEIGRTHSGFETQRRCHQKSKIGVSVASQKDLCPPKILKKKKCWNWTKDILLWWTEWQQGGRTIFAGGKFFLGWSGKLLGLVAKSFYSGGDKNFCHPPLKIVSPHPSKIFCHVTPKIVCYPIPPFFSMPAPKKCLLPHHEKLLPPYTPTFFLFPHCCPFRAQQPVLGSVSSFMHDISALIMCQNVPSK